MGWGGTIHKILFGQILEDLQLLDRQEETQNSLQKEVAFFFEKLLRKKCQIYCLEK